VARTDNKAIFKNLPVVRSPAAGGAGSAGPQDYQGQWKNVDGKYQIGVSIAGRESYLAASIERDRLTITGDGKNLVFSRED
jgi:hypothetical protein